MTKSELIEAISADQQQLSAKDVELAVKTIIEHMATVLSSGERIEIRGFGSFSLHYRAPRVGRNPKTGESVGLSGKYVPHFKPGKELRDRVNESLQEGDPEPGSPEPSRRRNQSLAGSRGSAPERSREPGREPGREPLRESRPRSPLAIRREAKG